MSNENETEKFSLPRELHSYHFDKSVNRREREEDLMPIKAKQSEIEKNQIITPDELAQIASDNNNKNTMMSGVVDIAMPMSNISSYRASKAKLTPEWKTTEQASAVIWASYYKEKHRIMDDAVNKLTSDHGVLGGFAAKALVAYEGLMDNVKFLTNPEAEQGFKMSLDPALNVRKLRNETIAKLEK